MPTTSACQPAQGGELGRSSHSRGRTSMLLLSSHPHWVALALKPPAWKPGEPKKTTRRHLHLYIHLQPPARVPDPGLGVGLPGAGALPLSLPMALCPAQAEGPSLPALAIACRHPKLEPRHREMRFSRQTCSYFKAKFSFAISEMDRFQLRISPASISKQPQ